MGFLLRIKYMKYFIDAGCNLLQGYSKLKEIENITDETIKIFIESNPECCFHIEEKLKNIPNSFLFKNALSITNKKYSVITRSENTCDIGATIMGKDFFDSSMAKYDIFDNNPNVYEVESITLKEIFDKFDIDLSQCILKLDIEGMEYLILNDLISKKTLPPKIYCEFHIHNLEQQQEKDSICRKFFNLDTAILDWE